MEVPGMGVVGQAVLISASIVMIKHYAQKQLEKERVHFILQLVEHYPEAGTGTWRQELM